MKKPVVAIIKSSPWKAAHLIKSHPEYSAIFNLIQRYESKIHFVLVGTSDITTMTQLQGDSIALDIGYQGFLTYEIKLMKILFKHRPNLVIVLGGLKTLPVAIYCLLSRNSRYVSVFVGSFGYYGRKRLGRFLNNLAFSTLGVLLQLSKKDILTLFALSKYVREGIRKLAPTLNKDIQLISYPISPIFDDHKDDAHVEDARPTVLTVTGIEPVKGLDTLVKAISHIEKKPKVLVVGPIRDQSYANELMQLVAELGLKDDIIFTGHVEYEYLPSYYKSATLFVFPTREDCLGVVILEALHSNLPVVATSVGGIPDMIQNGVNGILVKPNDPRELANAISSLLSDNSKRQRLAQNTRDVLQKRYYRGRITLEEALNQSVELWLKAQYYTSRTS